MRLHHLWYKLDFDLSNKIWANLIPCLRHQIECPIYVLIFYDCMIESNALRMPKMTTLLGLLLSIFSYHSSHISINVDKVECLARNSTWKTTPGGRTGGVFSLNFKSSQSPLVLINCISTRRMFYIFFIYSTKNIKLREYVCEFKEHLNYI